MVDLASIVYVPIYTGFPMRATPYTAQEKDRKLAELRRVVDSPNSSGLAKLLALSAIAKLKGQGSP